MQYKIKPYNDYNEKYEFVNNTAKKLTDVPDSCCRIIAIIYYLDWLELTKYHLHYIIIIFLTWPK